MLDKLKVKLKKFFDDEKITDIADTIKFILSYGLMGLFSLLVFISIIGINFVIVDYIRNSVLWTIIVFLIGSGSSYYILMDISNFYGSMRKNKR